MGITFSDTPKVISKLLMKIFSLGPDEDRRTCWKLVSLKNFSPVDEKISDYIICNKCHNTILKQSLVTCLTCDKTMKKCWHWNVIWTNTPYWKTRHNKCWKQTEWTFTYARAATYNSNQNVHVCVATQMCRKVYLKHTTK